MIKVIRIAFLMVALSLGFTKGTLAGGGKGVPVKWITPNELSELAAETKKPVIIDVYTSWCHYCRVMDNTTWSNDSVAAYLEENYYAVKLNAESKDPYSWKGAVYEYDPRYKVNMLAIKLLGGSMMYPSTIIIPVKGEPEILKGAFSAKELEMILKYYGSRTNEVKSPQAFMKTFTPTWK